MVTRQGSISLTDVLIKSEKELSGFYLEGVVLHQVTRLLTFTEKDA